MEKVLRPYIPKTVPDKISRQMSLIKGKGNKSTEKRLRMILVSKGIRGFKLHMGLKGRPDFFFAEKKIVIFVDGCFWHGCPKCFKGTKTNHEFWRLKIALNKKRDQKNNSYYRRQGHRVIRIWEHDLKNADKLDSLITLLRPS